MPTALWKRSQMLLASSHTNVLMFSHKIGACWSVHWYLCNMQLEQSKTWGKACIMAPSAEQRQWTSCLKVESCIHGKLVRIPKDLLYLLDTLTKASRSSENHRVFCETHGTVWQICQALTYLHLTESKVVNPAREGRKKWKGIVYREYGPRRKSLTSKARQKQSTWWLDIEIPL